MRQSNTVIGHSTSFSSTLAAAASQIHHCLFSSFKCWLHSGFGLGYILSRQLLIHSRGFYDSIYTDDSQRHTSRADCPFELHVRIRVCNSLLHISTQRFTCTLNSTSTKLNLWSAFLKADSLPILLTSGNGTTQFLNAKIKESSLTLFCTSPPLTDNHRMLPSLPPKYLS